MRPEFQEIVDEVSRLLARQAVLEDREFNLIAFSPHGAPIDEVRQKSILQRHSTVAVKDFFEEFGIATTEHPVTTPASDDLGILARLCLPVRSHGVTYGYLWLLDDPGTIDSSELPAAVHLAERAAGLMAQQARAREDLEYQLRDLLSADPEAIERAADDIDARGVIGRQHPVAVIELRLVPPASGPVPLNLWRLPRTVLAVPEAEHTTLLVPADLDRPAIAHAVARSAWDLAAERLDPACRDELVVGIGGVRRDVTQAASSRREARLAVQAAATVLRLRPVVTWADLGVFRLLGCAPDRALADAVLDPAARLFGHDDPDLALTALTFLDRAGHVQQTASDLSVHRQTVYNRLQRVAEVTGLDLGRGDHRLVLHLGLTLAPVLRSGPADRDQHG